MLRLSTMLPEDCSAAVVGIANSVHNEVASVGRLLCRFPEHSCGLLHATHATVVAFNRDAVQEPAVQIVVKGGGRHRSQVIGRPAPVQLKRRRRTPRDPLGRQLASSP